MASWKWTNVLTQTVSFFISFLFFKKAGLACLWTRKTLAIFSFVLGFFWGGGEFCNRGQKSKQCDTQEKNHKIKSFVKHQGEREVSETHLLWPQQISGQSGPFFPSQQLPTCFRGSNWDVCCLLSAGMDLPPPWTFDPLERSPFPAGPRKPPSEGGLHKTLLKQNKILQSQHIWPNNKTILGENQSTAGKHQLTSTEIINYL